MPRSLSVGNSFSPHVRGTRTTTGLIVEPRPDEMIHQKGRKASERQFKELALSAHDVRPIWSHTPYGTTRFPLATLANFLNMLFL